MMFDNRCTLTPATRAALAENNFGGDSFRQQLQGNSDVYPPIRGLRPATLDLLLNPFEAFAMETRCFSIIMQYGNLIRWC